MISGRTVYDQPVTWPNVCSAAYMHKLFLSIPTPAVLMKILSQWPFSTTLVSPVTILTPAVSASSAIEETISSRSSMSNPSSIINAAEYILVQRLIPPDHLQCRKWQAFQYSLREKERINHIGIGCECDHPGGTGSRAESVIGSFMPKRAAKSHAYEVMCLPASAAMTEGNLFTHKGDI